MGSETPCSLDPKATAQWLPCKTGLIATFPLLSETSIVSKYTAGLSNPGKATVLYLINTFTSATGILWCMVWSRTDVERGIISSFLGLLHESKPEIKKIPPMDLIKLIINQLLIVRIKTTISGLSLFFRKNNFCFDKCRLILHQRNQSFHHITLNKWKFLQMNRMV